jgi:hypothetical protein
MYDNTPQLLPNILSLHPDSPPPVRIMRCSTKKVAMQGGLRLTRQYTYTITHMSSCGTACARCADTVSNHFYCRRVKHKTSLKFERWIRVACFAFAWLLARNRRVPFTLVHGYRCFSGPNRTQSGRGRVRFRLAPFCVTKWAWCMVRGWRGRCYVSRLFAFATTPPNPGSFPPLRIR